MELEATLSAPVCQCDKPGSSANHRLEEGAALIAMLQSLGRDVEAADLQPQAVDEHNCPASLTQGSEILIKRRLART